MSRRLLYQKLRTREWKQTNPGFFIFQILYGSVLKTEFHFLQVKHCQKQGGLFVDGRTVENLGKKCGIQIM